MESFCFLLENRIIRGFGWINYKRNKKDLSVISKRIFQYQHKREPVEIYEGADTVSILTYADWEKRCRELLETFFSIGSISSGMILFPDTEITLCNYQIIKVETWQIVMSTLHAWCKFSSPNDAAGLIIRNYDLEDHLDFCGIKRQEIRDTLNFNDSVNMFDFQKNDQRFLVFNPSLKIILLIRLVELKKGELQMLKTELDYCIKEVNLLCFLLKDVLEDTGVIVTGLITYLGENPHGQTVCKDCANVFVSFEIFESVQTFISFWQRFATEKNIENLATRAAKSSTDYKADVFKSVGSKILGYLAHLQFVNPICRSQDPILPIAENTATGNIKQAELLLDRYQIKIAYSSDKLVWLEGNYGTGKTIVALKKLELLLKTLKEKEVIYYVNFSGRSQLDFVIKQKFKNNEKVKSIRGGFSLSKIINTQILPKERELDTENINLFVDEYSSQDLSIVEVRSLGQTLKGEEKFKNSTVFIVVEPIQIHRFDNFYDENGIKREYYEKRHERDELIQIMGMKVCTLNNVMRTTVQINTLVEITQQHLNNQSNQYVRKKPGFEIPVQYSESKEIDSSFSSPSPQSRKIIDYDEIYRLMPTETIISKTNYQEKVTKYCYTCDSQMGHNIQGPLPQLIKLEQPADHFELTALIAAVLDKIIKPADTKSKRTAIIHFEPTDPPLWLKILIRTMKLTMTNDLEKFLTDATENLVLVKNFNFIKGLEFSDVLLILESNEHYLRHFIPDAIARCRSNLFILIKPSPYENYKSGTVADLADEWQKNNENNSLLRIINIGFCCKTACNIREHHRMLYCVDKEGTSYGIHKNSQSYMNLVNEIKSVNVKDTGADLLKKREEGKAV